jgi:uncharacterized protein (UPF0548 family)
MWFARRPSPRVLDDLLASLAARPLSYPEVGMSRGDRAVPAHYGREEHEVALDVDFAAARDALAAFATHRLPYMFLHPAGVRVREGLDVIVCARIGPLWTANPCRVVYVDDSDGRFAYGYGTLEGHSEHGEEMFAVERVASGRVRAMTIAHARPQDMLARLGKPIAHRVQRRIKVDYMQALLRGSK